MPSIFDNIDLALLPAVLDSLTVVQRADFCLGYFNLRGWGDIGSRIDPWLGGDEACCRVLLDVPRLPEDELRAALGSAGSRQALDNQTAIRLKKRVLESYRRQLAFGCPSSTDEVNLRRLGGQLRRRQVVVKLFLRHPLAARLYLCHPATGTAPIAYLGSSNLTLASLTGPGELNVDVSDRPNTRKLAEWFEALWLDRWSIDITAELADIIEQSWVRESPPPPYHIYIKIAYHLSHEARAGLAEFKIPADFGNKLFEFQKAAVKIAAHHLNQRGGVLIGDVVGLGKTLMATTVARIFEDDFGLETLILCPKNLVAMWQDYRDRYRLRGKVLSLSKVQRELPGLRRYRLVLIDESHNLRNREGQRYRAIQEYVRANDSKCILLSATPYNKTYLDLGNQLRLFLPEDRELGIRPEALLQHLGPTEFARLQVGPRTLAAFERSGFPDDWRELMRLYLVRRTRGFIQDNYAETDASTGRKFLTLDDGTRSYFPTRQPRTAKFTIDESDPGDQYARLYAQPVVDAISGLNLPRYGLGNYLAPPSDEVLTPLEVRDLQALSRAGKRLMGFCRTNLFKRLESSGQSFLQSVERHVLRNCVFLHALERGLPLPIGTQDASLLDPDGDGEDEFDVEQVADEEVADDLPLAEVLAGLPEFQARAEATYGHYRAALRQRFRWVRAALFVPQLAADLSADCQALLGVLQASGDWDAARDQKLLALQRLLTHKHPGEKVLIFSQFADTVHYLESQLTARGIPLVAGVTGGSADPTRLVYRFSPVSNQRREEVASANELRVLLATDILSEGQNLQDCAIVVNYDLPWAIIRLIQRAGRVDRIGQQAQEIRCYSFLPAQGVERILHLRARVRQRLRENAEVVGTDEAFFEDDRSQALVDLYHEKAGLLDGDADSEVDLASYAYQIWKNAIEANPELQKIVPELPPVVFSTKLHEPVPGQPEGVLVHLRTGAGNDALAWVDREGRTVTESQYAILQAAACQPETPALPRAANHHELVENAVTRLAAEERTVGGALGRPSGARFRTYERLMRYANEVAGTLFEPPQLHRAIDELYRLPLRPTAAETLNRQLRAGISDADLAELVVALREEDRLCLAEGEQHQQEAQIVCSLGLARPQ